MTRSQGCLSGGRRRQRKKNLDRLLRIRARDLRLVLVTPSECIVGSRDTNFVVQLERNVKSLLGVTSAKRVFVVISHPNQELALDVLSTRVGSKLESAFEQRCASKAAAVRV